MKFYMAPMEGITGYIFRNALQQYFGDGIDRFYSPFIVSHEKRALGKKDVRDIIPEHNDTLTLIPQVLTNSVQGFVELAQAISDMGYDEVNLNLGCPSKTVSSKGRGSGFLRYPEELHQFLEGIYERSPIAISIKTRIGYDSPEEFAAILEMYNEYPVKELIIHPRTQGEFYRGTVHRDVFAQAMEEATIQLCFNGDINSVADYEGLCAELNLAECDKVGAVMLGRGVLHNPALIRELTGGAAFNNEELYAFLCKLRDDYQAIGFSEIPLLHHMKEIWTYLKTSFPEKEKGCKKIMKSKHLAEYEIIVKEVLDI